MKILLKTVLIFLFTASIGACNPMKVTDPADPRFDPDKFSFRDNMFDREAKIDAFRKLFPVGTPKAFVDRVLVEAGGAKSMEVKELPESWHVWRYDEPPIPGLPGGPAHIFVFNQENTVENLYFSLTEYLYGTDITLEKLRKQYELKESSHDR